MPLPSPLSSFLSRANMSLHAALALMVAASSIPLLAIPRGEAFAQERAKTTLDNSMEHTFEFVANVPARREDETKTQYAARRKKIEDELLTRLLYRYKVAHGHGAKASIKPSGKVTLKLYSKQSPEFLQSIALGRGQLNMHAELDQSSLWESMLDPTSAANKLLPEAITVSDDDVHGIYLQSTDPARLMGFIDDIVLPSGRSLHLVRLDASGTWRTILLGEGLLSQKMVERVTLHTSEHTGSSYGQITLSSQGQIRWKKLVEESERPLVLALDREPITTLYRPALSATITPLEVYTSHSAPLTFSCDPTWIGASHLTECVTLVAARASAPIPIKLAPSLP